MTLRFGVLWPFRNPEWARVAWDELYRSHLDLIVDSERLGFDNAWLTEHHFVDDGYSPSLLPIAAAIAARTNAFASGRSAAAAAAQSGPGRRGHRHGGPDFRRAVRPRCGAGLSAGRVRRSGHSCPGACRAHAGGPDDRAPAAVRRVGVVRREVQHAAQCPHLPARAAAATSADLGGRHGAEGDRAGGADGLALPQRWPGSAGSTTTHCAPKAGIHRFQCRRDDADLRRVDPRTGLADRGRTVALHGIRLCAVDL